MTEIVERWDSDVREYDLRLGNSLDEDGKLGVILALAPQSVQNHCRLNSHSTGQDDALRRLSGTGGRCRFRKRADGLVDAWKGQDDHKGKGKYGTGKDEGVDCKRTTRAREAEAKTTPKRLRTSQAIALAANLGHAEGLLVE